jgi:hypothetical protein
MAPHGPVDHLGHHDSPVSGIGGHQRQLPIYGQPRTADARSYAAAFAPRARRPKPASSAGTPARGKTPAPLKSVLETEYVVALSPPEATQSASGTWQQV